MEAEAPATETDALTPAATAPAPVSTVSTAPPATTATRCHRRAGLKKKSPRLVKGFNVSAAIKACLSKS